MTNEPKYIGNESYSLLKKDALQMFKKGKFSTIPLISSMIILFSMIFIFTVVNISISRTFFSIPLLMFDFLLFFLIFNMFILAFHHALAHLYTKSKFKKEENSDIFFNAFKNYKTMFNTLKKTIFILAGLFSSMLLICIIIYNIDNVAVVDVDISLAQKIGAGFVMYSGFCIVQYLIFHEVFCIKDKKIDRENMHFIYMNQIFSDMSLEESILFTEHGTHKNKDLFYTFEIDKLNYFFLAFIPFINLFVYLYHTFIYHAAWQRIYNNQEGITAKEDIKKEVYDKNMAIQ